MPPFERVSDRCNVIAPGSVLRVVNEKFKLIYFFEGGLLMSFEGGKEVVIEKGDALAVSVNGVQEYRPVDERREGKLDVFIVDFVWPTGEAGQVVRRRGRRGRGFAEVLRERLEGGVKHLPGLLTAENLQLVRLMMQEMEGEGSAWRVSGLCMALVAGVLGGGGGHGEERHMPRGATVVRHAQQFMQEHLREELTLGQVAWRVGVSEEYLSRLFRQHAGVTVFDYLRKLRVDRAKRLLATTEWPVTRVAGDCGLSSSTLLCRHFRSLTGMTPSGYRMSMAKKESFAAIVFVRKGEEKRREG